MSETEHWKGKLIPTGKTLSEFNPEVDDIYDLDESCVVLDGEVFTVDRSDVDQYQDIAIAKKNEDGTIDFEVKYYNGACSFHEAINSAIAKT